MSSEHSSAWWTISSIGRRILVLETSGDRARELRASGTDLKIKR